MPSKHKTPLLGWHPPAELSAWVREEAKRRDVTIAVILNEAVEKLRGSGCDETCPDTSAHRALITGRHPRRDGATVALHD